MSTAIQRRRGTTAQHSSFTGLNGELTVDTDKEVVVVHDGATAGGYPQMRENGSNSALALGSAGTPSLKFTGDTNTGIYSPGADQVAISTNGTGRLFVDSSGNIGVGSASNVYAGLTTLTVGNATGSVVDWNIAGTRTGTVAVTASSMVVGSAASVPVVFQSANTERMRLDSSGRLGLGTSSPNYELHINASDSTNFIQLTNSGTGTGASDGFLIYNNGVNATVSNQEAGYLSLETSGQARLHILSDGKVGIGTTSPSTPLHVKGDDGIRIENVSLSRAYQLLAYTGGGSPNANFRIYDATAGADRLNIDTSGRVLVGTSSASANGTLFLQGTNAGATNGGTIRMAAGTTSPANGAELGIIAFSDSSHSQAAFMLAKRDGGTWTSGSSMPSRLEFSTTADGASSPTERMRIQNDGLVMFGTTTGFSVTSSSATGAYVSAASGLVVARNADIPGFFMRQTDDGELIRFVQAGFAEGSISVSGSTVSYNGAHLSRWSQLPGGATREEILRGTVLSNIDEMCNWGEEENEQLNRMKVSDVEGDPNVAGVFQSWDDEDDTYTDDFYCAMTGDFIIRIAENVTVQRGDLLMSAGDGTAKPQDDDIIRSKTIAKVTSTHITCTYDDGSYCVPCVLMAC